MEYKFAHFVETVITVFFPGGIEEFNRKGHITIIPHPAKEIVVYNPDLDKTTIAKLKSLAVKDKESVHVITEKNFEGLSGDELRDLNIRINENMIRLDPMANVLFDDNSNMVIITVPNVDDGDEILETIFDSLRNIDGLLIAYVIAKKSVFKIEPKRSKQIREDRGVISADDVTNLIIAIENSKTVEDLLN